MTKTWNIQFDSKGFEEILLSDGVHDIVREQTDIIASKARGSGGAGCEYADHVNQDYLFGSKRWAGHVTAANYEAREQEAKRKNLSGAV